RAYSHAQSSTLFSGRLHCLGRRSADFPVRCNVRNIKRLQCGFSTRVSSTEDEVELSGTTLSRRAGKTDFSESKFRTLNFETAANRNSVRSGLFIARPAQPEHIPLSSSGGEGRGEEAVFSYSGHSWGVPGRGALTYC